VAHDALVPGGEAFVGQLQVTEGIVLVHIDASVSR
jgi:hypothetical protein